MFMLKHKPLDSRSDKNVLNLFSKQDRYKVEQEFMWFVYINYS